MKKRAEAMFIFTGWIEHMDGRQSLDAAAAIPEEELYKLDRAANNVLGTTPRKREKQGVSEESTRAC